MKLECLTDAHDEALVVFLLGTQVRRPWRVDQWGYVAFAMKRMLAELEANKARADDAGEPSLGYFGGFTVVGSRGPQVTQYWRSAEDLERYAGSADQRHRPAWLAVYRMMHRSRRAAVGLWHETYVVAPGAHESIYINMAPIGLGAAVGAVPVARRGRTARERLGGGTAVPDRP